MKLARMNALGLEEFVDLLGGIYEHSPWVAERVWLKRPFRSRDDLRALMRLEVEAVDRNRQLILLRAHPDLGTRAKIGEHSTREQKGAGLDQLTRNEYETLLGLNRQYREKFGFPFICAVRGSGKQDIFAALAARIDSSLDAEFSEAMSQVHQIAAFRLEDLIEPQ